MPSAISHLHFASGSTLEAIRSLPLGAEGGSQGFPLVRRETNDASRTILRLGFPIEQFWRLTSARTGLQQMDEFNS
jgi:hypothetical protein